MRVIRGGELDAFLPSVHAVRNILCVFPEKSNTWAFAVLQPFNIEVLGVYDGTKLTPATPLVACWYGLVREG